MSPPRAPAEKKVVTISVFTLPTAIPFHENKQPLSITSDIKKRVRERRKRRADVLCAALYKGIGGGG